MFSFEVMISFIILSTLISDIVLSFQTRPVYGTYFRFPFSESNSKAYTKSHQNLFMQDLADRIRDSVIRKYDNKVPRIVNCWNDFIQGKKLSRYLDEEKKTLQTANCFVDGLEAKSFHDVKEFPWALELEKNHKVFLEELVQYESKRKMIGSKDIDSDPILQVNPNSHDEGVWLGPRDTSGSHYGPEWKTLGLQDRSVWSAELSPEFPKTIKIMKDLNVPACEVFYAKQGPNSGLKPHSDNNNFIMTCHVALDVPEGQCWIKVGDETHYWKNGKTCIFDTSGKNNSYII